MKSITGKTKSLFGMVHVQALPGSPRGKLSIKEIALIAATEANMIKEAGFDSIILENMHDVPYLKSHVGAEIVAAMTRIALEVREAVDIPIGIQILAGANKEAVAVAHASGCQFVRVEGFVFAHVADEGIIEGCAGELLRYRKQIGAENIKVCADIKKKHSSHSITSDISIAETANAAEFFLADAVIVTGDKTGSKPAKQDVKDAKAHCSIPTLIGSGTTPDAIADLWEYADGFIVGSYIKEGGIWSNPIDMLRAKQIIAAARKLEK